MFYVQMLLFFSASINASIIMSRMVPTIRPPGTVFIDTTGRTSRTSKIKVLRSGSLPIIQGAKNSSGFDFPCNQCKPEFDVNRRRFGPSATEPGVLRKTFPAFPWHLLPNWLTYCRCAAIPMLIVFYYSSRYNIIPCGIFAFAAVTDYLDGYLARRWDISSDFGAFLDPVVS